MIHLTALSITYAGASRPAISCPDLTIDEGELVLLVGPTGSGKTTLLRCLNGLVPHFSGGTLAGRVLIDGRDTRDHRPRDLAELVGFVGQDPLSGFVTESVEEEIAYGMETLAVGQTAMRRRVEEVLDLMGLADLRTRPLRELSGGQQQRVAVAAVLASGPRTLVLDEPTSALDPVSAEDVLASLDRLVHDLGVTVVLAEHRLERTIHHADSVILVEAGRATEPLAPSDAMQRALSVPPVVELGRELGWSPLPLSIRDARRHATDLRRTLPDRPQPPVPGGEATIRVKRLYVRRSARPVLHEIDLAVAGGRVTALMGRNGSGKSTLLGVLCGLVRSHSGSVDVCGLDPRTSRPRDLIGVVGMVPQDAGSLLYSDSVEAECRSADRDFDATPGTAAGILSSLAALDPTRHPRDLSEGQRMLLALSVILAGDPKVLLLDEPTRGLDYGAKRRLADLLRARAARGVTVLMATHDVEIAAEVADDVLLLADGDVIGAGPAREILCDSPSFAPQVAKVMHPRSYLTVHDVLAARDAR
ncbi:ABC transporter ATP-binding protein [Leekyejoonella antrihumi]|uniref:ATP-binding cassette domain-containing protein n=1 Tax=Leekyejoonella antrihumi TaxID=1660198 RepID=A0A563E3P0_9MICO|nr:ATP-binding cassette domain-containing protein [Leekyejoonella antrihumi]TWP37025.1 ATP-binding cassette domain-containing protein [Leekyejoonella antrihumi]